MKNSRRGDLTRIVHRNERISVVHDKLVLKARVLRGGTRIRFRLEKGWRRAEPRSDRAFANFGLHSNNGNFYASVVFRKEEGITWCFDWEGPAVNALRSALALSC